MRKLIYCFLILSSLSCQVLRKNEGNAQSTSFSVYEKDKKIIVLAGTIHWAPRAYYYRLISKIDGAIRRYMLSPNEVAVFLEGLQDSRKTKFIFSASPWGSECTTSILRALRGGHRVDSSELGWLYSLGCVSIENKSYSHFDFFEYRDKRLGVLPVSWSRQHSVLDSYLFRFKTFLSDTDLEKETLTMQLAYDLFEKCSFEFLPTEQGQRVSSVDSEIAKICSEVAEHALIRMREDRLFNEIHMRFENPDWRFEKENWRSGQTSSWFTKPRIAFIPWGNAHFQSIEKWILAQGYAKKSEAEISWAE